MKNLRQTNVNIHRDAWIEINLANLKHNIKELRKNILAGTKLLGVVKADAYGHGAVILAPVILESGVDMLGVASIDEGIELRNAKIDCDILILGAVPMWAVESAVDADLSISIFSEEHIEACRLAYERSGVKPKVHLKIDTGMNRIGVSVDNAIDFIKRLQNCEFIDFRGIFTHLAVTENKEETKIQINKWNRVISQVDTQGLLLHVQNTAGTMYYKIPTTNMCRVGIALYGLYPDLPLDADKSLYDLKPLLSLKSRIVHIHEAKDGEGVSYAHTYKTNGNRIIATIPVGYADGISRKLSNKICGILNGQKVPQVGNITMDQMMFDITDVDAKVGDIITLLGDGNTIDEWAHLVQTINYEITCRLKVRLPRIYTR